MNNYIKPIIIFVLTYLFSAPLISAEEYHRKGYSEDLYLLTNEVTQEQHLKHFLLDLLSTEIIKAANNHYKEKSISGIAYNWESNYNVVEISEPPLEGNKEFDYPYIVSVTIDFNNGNNRNLKMYGPDKLTFGIIPGYLNDKSKDIPYPLIKLIKYEHLDSPNN